MTFELRVPVQQNSDERLTCFVCFEPNCDLRVEMAHDKSAVWIGVHQRCCWPYLEQPEEQSSGE